PVQVEWWNLDRRRVETATLPAIQFEATPNPAAALEFPPEPEPVIQATAPKPNRFKYYLRLAEVTAILLIALALLLWTWVRFGVRLVAQWKSSRKAYRNSEAAFFAKLKKASSAGNAPEAYSFLLGWLNRFRPGVGLEQFLSNSGDAELKREVESLASRLYGGSSATWSGTRMVSRLQRVRSLSHREMRTHSALPPLNPARGT
ncbi:MAG TPA: hypothetical protein VH369_10315, partial [Bryobacteraceae bacterium]